MRRGQQVCEGADKDSRKCLSHAHWNCQIFQSDGQVWLTLYLCSSCYDALKLTLFGKVVFSGKYSANGFETQPGHEAATLRHRRLFAAVLHADFPQQMSLFSRRME
jgi:hypothetical protein